MHSCWSALGGVETISASKRWMNLNDSSDQWFQDLWCTNMYIYLRFPQTKSPEPSRPGHAPCIPSLLKLCENTVSFCYGSTSFCYSVNIPQNFKACSQLIECLGNSAVCSLSSLIRIILKNFALLTVLLAAMGIAASPLGVVDFSVFSMPYFRLADSRETIWMRKNLQSFS